MPDLRDLYRSFQERTAAPGAAWGGAMSSPLQTLKGVASGVGHALQGIATIPADLIQSVAPTGMKVPFSTGAIVPQGTPDPRYSNLPPAGSEIGQRFATALNAIGLGIPHQIAENYGQTGSLDKAAIETVKQILPFREADALLTGRPTNDPQGILTPEQFGETATVGALKFLPMLKALKGASGSLTRGVKKGGEYRGGKFAFEIANTSEPEMAQAARFKNIADLKAKLNEMRNGDAPPAAKMAVENAYLEEIHGINMERGLTPDVSQRLFRSVPLEVYEAAFMDGLLKAAQEGRPVQRLAYEAIEAIADNPARVEPTIQAMVKHNLTPEQMSSVTITIMDTLARDIRKSGQNLQVISELQNLIHAKLLRENPELAAATKELTTALNLPNSPVNLYTKAANYFRHSNQFWRAVVTSQPVTTARNFTQGAGNTAFALFDSAMLGVWSKGLGEIAEKTGKIEKAPTMVEAFTPFIDKLLTLQELAFGGKRQMKQWFEHMESGDRTKRVYEPIQVMLDAVSDAIPQEYNHVFSAPVQDIVVGNVMADGYKQALPNIKKAWGNVETLHDAFQFGSTVASTFNTMSEMFWRKFFFASKLKEKARYHGYNSVTELIEAARETKGQTPKYFGPSYTAETLRQALAAPDSNTRFSQLLQRRLENMDAQAGRTLRTVETKVGTIKHMKEAKRIRTELEEAATKLEAGADWTEVGGGLSQEAAEFLKGTIRKPVEAITESADYALKETFAHTPTSGFGATVMKVYQEFPFMYALASPFPRFMLNATQWLFERNPLELTQVYHPKMREMIINIAKDPSKVRDPHYVQMFAQAHTGAALWAAAHFIHNSPGLSGPKYYHLKMGEDAEGNPEYMDMRPYNPLVQYMFMEHTMKAILNGETPNLTSGELTEALLGMRRLSEVPIFALPDIIRQVDSSNPEAFMNSIKPLAGQWASGFFMPFRTLGDFMSAAGVSDTAVNKDISGNELVGPTINQIPGLRNMLPDRPDPFSGGASRQEHPGLRMLGPTVRHMTKLEQLVSETGMPLNDLLGNYADPEADRLVRKHIGELLGSRVNGQQLANLLGERINQITDGKNVEFKKTVIQKVYEGLRERARSMAEQENPYAFLEYKVRQQPEVVRPILRERLAPLQQERVRRMMQQ